MNIIASKLGELFAIIIPNLGNVIQCSEFKYLLQLLLNKPLT
jgi:hypothetical protein